MAVSDEEFLLQLDGLVEGVKKMVVGPRMRLGLKKKNQKMRKYLPLRWEGETKKGLREACCRRPWCRQDFYLNSEAISVMTTPQHYFYFNFKIFF